MSNIRKEPIGHTCPDIDRAINNLKEILSEICAYERDAHNSETDNVLVDRTTLDQWASSISDICEGRSCDLENLRDANSTLRQWGNDLVSELENQDNEVYKLINENERMADLISELKSENEDMLCEIRELQNQ